MRNISKQTGYTLVELMIVVGIIGVVAATAIPTYNNYISTTCLSTAKTNLETLALHLEHYNIENTTYLAGTHNAGDNLTSSALMKPLHWDPNDNDQYTYTVTLNSAYNGKTYAYVVSVEGKLACADATAKYGATKKGFHQQ